MAVTTTIHRAHGANEGALSSRDAATRKRAGIPGSEGSRGMFTAELVVRPADVVFVKGVLEASEGLAALFATRGGELTIAAPHDRSRELLELLEDLAEELGATLRLPHAEPSPASTAAERPA